MSIQSTNGDRSTAFMKTMQQSLFVLVFLPAMVLICNFFFDTQAGGERYLVDLSKSVPDLPEGMLGAEQIRAALARMALDEQPVNIMDDKLNDVVCQVFESSPYVERVTKLERKFPGGLKVGLEFKQPLTAVEANGRFVLVDQYGELLPLRVERDQVVRPLITIHPGGDSSIDPGEFTEDWFLSALKEGVAVLKDISARNDHPSLDDIIITAIDISNFGGRIDPKKAEISLAIDRQWFDSKTSKQKATMLTWGRSTEHPLSLVELPVQKKLDHLELVIRARANGIAGLRHIDLRFEKVYFVE
ncbi:MAG: hypothetical protein ACI97A_002143 [Planctomycetota bacterium]|jgi:hypothetical protein